tara:strand:+ start:759 stop:1190 length:432 start_codon:yes stop_codon:yes gene_type:complete
LNLIKKTVGALNSLLGLPYYIIKYVINTTYKVLKEIPNYIKKGIELVIKTVKSILNIVWKPFPIIAKLIKKPFVWLWKITKTIKPKAIGKWIVDVVKESIAQIFTLLGFFIAWFTLTGSAQDIVGIAIIVSTIIWLLTIRLRD